MNPFMIRLKNLLLFFLICANYVGAYIDDDLSPPPLSPAFEEPTMTSLRPSIAIIVGVLATLFSMTLLLLLFVKYCKRENMHSTNASPPVLRKNSGVERTVVEMLPLFRFGSLRGDKDGLECAVCLNPFEPTEVLRLLPKCKHAFHIECVDTWLDAHSTCPLCRYQVNPEDNVLIGDDTKTLGYQQTPPPPPPQECDEIQRLDTTSQRVSGRHSSAGERKTDDGLLQIVVQRPGTSENHRESSDAKSILTTAKSLDSWNIRKNKSDKNLSVGFLDRQRTRRDEIMPATEESMNSERRRRLEHRIILSSSATADAAAESGLNRRWSDVHATDLLYLRSEMLISSGSSLLSSTSTRPMNVKKVRNGKRISGTSGMRRTSSNHHGHHHEEQQQRQREEHEQRRQTGLVSRWLAWTHSHSQTQQQQPQPVQTLVRSEPTNL